MSYNDDKEVTTMKNFTKRISAILTSVLMASTMMVSASAASVTWSTTCPQSGATSSNCNITSSGCLSGIDVNALLGSQSSLVGGTTQVITSGCKTSTVAGASSKCTSTANTSQSNSTAAKSNCGTSNTSSNCTSGKTAAVQGTSTSRTCTTSPTQSVKVYNNSTTANSSTFYSSIYSLLKQFGINQSNSTGTATATPQTSGGNVAMPTPSAAGTANSASVDSLSFEQQVVTLVNQQRAANGLAPLTLSTELSNVARTKSQDMHDNNYFSHTSPTYGSPFDMLTSFGISYSSAGENIAMGYATPEAVMNAWMNSPGHRANILNASYTKIGVGYVASGNYWTQEFIG